jgi:hypothetical protein
MMRRLKQWSSEKGEETASDVRSEYKAEIGKFFREVFKSSGSQRPESTLEALLDWGRDAVEKIRYLRESLDREETARRRAEDQIKELTQSLQVTEAQYADMRHRHRLMEKEHEREVTNLTIEHSKTTETINTQYQAEKDRLVAQLLVNQDNNQGWPDDKLKTKFQRLQKIIEDLTCNPEFFIPPGASLGSNLDPTGFLSREGSDNSHFMLRGAIWSIIQEHFFSAPFGFGALGPKEAQTELQGLYGTWLRFFEPELGAGKLPWRLPLTIVEY